MWYDRNFSIYLYAGDFGKISKKKLASMKNWTQFINTFNVKAQDALGRYKLNGLPSTVSERVVLEALLWYGCVCFFEKEGSLMALPCAPNGSGFNVYGDVGSVWVYSRNGMLNKSVDTYIHGSDELAFLSKTNGAGPRSNYKGVVVWENATRFPFINQTIFFSEAIADAMRTLDVCRKNIKNPYIVVAEESIVPTVREYFEKRDNNEEYIISSGIFPAEKVQILPLVVNSDNLNSITSLIEWYEAKYRELCGIDNNSQIDKKGENLIRAEVSVNDEYTSLSLDKVIKYIQEGLDDVNKIFGTNITVEINREEKDIKTAAGEEDIEDETDEDVQPDNK